jgi:hypothetical protein
MIRTLIAIAIITGLASCVDYPTSNYTKPFIIIGKRPDGAYGAQYTYQDANGAQVTFTDYIERYEVGDTLK